MMDKDFEADGPGIGLEMDEECSELDEIASIDGDSMQGTSSSSVSMRSYATTLQSFIYANGRRYHSDRFPSGDYFMPNDEIEQERLDLYHHVFLLILGGRLAALPVEEIPLEKVLDVGTGTGIWAIDFAGEFPDAEVIGTDLSPIQPLWVPPNVRFEVADMEQPWDYMFEPNTFDYIHMRSLCGAIKDWDALLNEALICTKPGGWVEFQDYGCELFHRDGNVPEDCKLDQYLKLCHAAADQQSRSLTIAKTIKSRMISLGYEDVTEIVKPWPTSPWPKDKELKEIGRWGQQGILESLEPFSLILLTRIAGFTPDQVKALCADTAQEVQTAKGYYFLTYFVYGRKPLPKEEEEIDMSSKGKTRA